MYDGKKHMIETNKCFEMAFFLNSLETEDMGIRREGL